MSRSGKKRTVWLASLSVLLVGGLTGYRYFNSDENGTMQFVTVPVERGTVVSKVTATGTLSALVTVEVGSQVSGRIQSLSADFNSEVAQGQVLAQLDPQIFQAALEQAEANYASARASLAEAQAQAQDAQRQAERARNLADRRLIAEADAETAEASAEVALARVDSARAHVRQARASRDQAQVNLDYTTILSPIDGVVISRDVDVGQTVAASLQAPTLYILAEDLSRMQVNTSVAEADVGQLHQGMRATFTVDAYPGEEFEGLVRQVRNAAQTVQNVVTYDAVIDVENPELKLRPGMTANVTFIVAERVDVLQVSNAALRFRPPDSLIQQAAASRPSSNRAPKAANSPDGSETETPASATSPTESATDRPPVGGERPSDSASSHRSDRENRNPTTSARRRSDRGGDMSDASPEGTNGRTVWVLREGNPQPVRIQLGISDGSVTEIVAGEVQEGDFVITEAVGGDVQVTPERGQRRGGPPFMM